MLDACPLAELRDRDGLPSGTEGRGGSPPVEEDPGHDVTATQVDAVGCPWEPQAEEWCGVT